MTIEPPTLSSFSPAVTGLETRALSDGGFSALPNGTYRTDATAWAALVLEAMGSTQAYQAAAQRLCKDQMPDGRVPIDHGHPEVWWPTALAVVAWAGVEQFRLEKDRAVQFLLRVSGANPAKQPGDPVGHDTTLRGWSWIEGTHSWVEPTSLGLQALAAVGIQDHPRVQESMRLLLNRQLPHGGWNYGNTTIFGRELHPMPESTGAALAGLAGRVSRDEIVRSLLYLEGEIGRLRTPLSLGWGLLGLAAWERWPSSGEALVADCLAARSRYGDYDTSALCLLMLSAVQRGVAAKIVSSPEVSGNPESAVRTQ
ncbi:MAG: hypothetical protein OJF52_004167 [Nitrospira sp.]|nr:MAG: hypothetical protein OJF52_004167 [Nitrospira sp.]